MTLQFMGQSSNQLSHLARARLSLLSSWQSGLGGRRGFLYLSHSETVPAENGVGSVPPISSWSWAGGSMDRMWEKGRRGENLQGRHRTLHRSLDL